MTEVTIILIILAVLSLGGIIFILVKKFPQIAIINIETIPKERESKIKQELLLQRLERRRARMVKKLGAILKPFGKLIQFGFLRLHAYAQELERRHKVKKIKKDASGAGDINTILKEAQEFLDEKKWLQAENKFIEAIRLDNKNPDAYRGLGDLYMMKRDYVHARETLEFLIKLGKADSRIYATLGAVAREQGNLEEAKSDLLKSISLESKLVGAYVDLGLVYQSQGEHERAVEALVRAVEIEPANPRNLDLMLEESIIVGNKNLAEETFLKLREANPENQKLKEFRKRIDEIK